TAKYLGVTLDRRLRFHEQAEGAVSKGTATVLAISRLTRPTFGLAHRHVRQLYRAVARPRIEYGAAVRYSPVRPKENGRPGRKGSVGVATKLGKVQRLAARLIFGGFRTTATDVLTFHADLLPMEI
ncbi:uncharacterized protein SCHCODRAFT_01052103, partial [Schizophyllum commune H4-8]|uniref:uncharacterized protein n=1 Tax=Schizophyllum commune (strain H4-8 / FGSC 9210) TaxID=578458 RepID=UPI00215E60CC